MIPEAEYFKVCDEAFDKDKEIKKASFVWCLGFHSLLVIDPPC